MCFGTDLIHGELILGFIDLTVARSLCSQLQCPVYVIGQPSSSRLSQAIQLSTHSGYPYYCHEAKWLSLITFCQETKKKMLAVTEVCLCRLGCVYQAPREAPSEATVARQCCRRPGNDCLSRSSLREVPDHAPERAPGPHESNGDFQSSERSEPHPPRVGHIQTHPLPALQNAAVSPVCFA